MIRKKICILLTVLALISVLASPAWALTFADDVKTKSRDGTAKLLSLVYIGDQYTPNWSFIGVSNRQWNTADPWNEGTAYANKRLFYSNNPELIRYDLYDQYGPPPDNAFDATSEEWILASSKVYDSSVSNQLRVVWYHAIKYFTRNQYLALVIRNEGTSTAYVSSPAYGANVINYDNGEVAGAQAQKTFMAAAQTIAQKSIPAGGYIIFYQQELPGSFGIGANIMELQFTGKIRAYVVLAPVGGRTADEIARLWDTYPAWYAGKAADTKIVRGDMNAADQLIDLTFNGDTNGQKLRLQYRGYLRH